MMLSSLLVLLTVCVCDSLSVSGQRGQSVVLPCRYNTRTHGVLHVCWGRGRLPTSGCNQQLLQTDGRVVTVRESSRFQLLGRMEDGDVSMTIHNITDADAGLYGCRVEIPGAFNDEKHQVELVVTAPPTTTWTPSTPQTQTETPAAAQTTGHMTSETARTSSSNMDAEDPPLLLVLLCVLVGGAALLSIIGVFIFVRRRRSLNKTPQFSSSIVFTSTSSRLHLHSQSSAVDNIYQIDGGEYELAP